MLIYKIFENPAIFFAICRSINFENTENSTIEKAQHFTARLKNPILKFNKLIIPSQY
jgi:hypothetical protein